MRILLANDGALDAGGVATYLQSVGTGLKAREHDVGYLFCNTAQSGGAVADFATVQFNADVAGRDGVMQPIADWRPDVVYSHNMRPLDLERRLLDRFPVVKFMHGYFGTCISGLKMHAFPNAQPCERRFGAACVALYFPRRCGQWNLATMTKQYRWAAEQNGLFSRYRAVVVASRHMGDEYIRNGVPRDRVHVNPLFAPAASSEDGSRRYGEPRDQYRLLFLGRMTKLKGGDALIRAVAEVSRSVSKPMHIVLGGEGPQRAGWEQLAKRLGVTAEFPGWLDEPSRTEALQQADLLVMPSVWPEPFGFVGLEAARQGVPAVAFDVGGVREWLVPGETGWLATGSRPTAASLAKAITEALADPQQLRERGEAARRRAGELSLSAHLDRLEQLFALVRSQS